MGKIHVRGCSSNTWIDVKYGLFPQTDTGYLGLISAHSSLFAQAHQTDCFSASWSFPTVQGSTTIEVVHLNSTLRTWWPGLQKCKRRISQIQLEEVTHVHVAACMFWPDIWSFFVGFLLCCLITVCLSLGLIHFALYVSLKGTFHCAVAAVLVYVQGSVVNMASL